MLKQRLTRQTVARLVEVMTGHEQYHIDEISHLTNH